MGHYLTSRHILSRKSVESSKTWKWNIWSKQFLIRIDLYVCKFLLKTTLKTLTSKHSGMYIQNESYSIRHLIFIQNIMKKRNDVTITITLFCSFSRNSSRINFMTYPNWNRRKNISYQFKSKPGICRWIRLWNYKYYEIGFLM